jgi:hypothetical protein
MKKLYFLVLSIFTFSSVISTAQPAIEMFDDAGQSIIGDTITFNHVVDPNDPWQFFENKNFVDIVNKSGGTMTVGLIRHERQIVPNTFDYLCWGAQCFGERQAGSTPFWDVNDSVIVQSNDTASGLLGGLIIYHRPNGNAGTSIYEYEVYNRANRNQSSSIFVKLQTSFTTSIKEARAAYQFSVAPNPVKDQLTITFDQPLNNENTQLVIFDLMGKEVMNRRVQKGIEMELVEVDGLKPGLYFLSLIKEGERMVSKRVIKL